MNEQVSEQVKAADFDWNSGGNILIDMLTLHDGTILCISDGLICLYANQESFYDGAILGQILRPDENINAKAQP